MSGFAALRAAVGGCALGAMVIGVAATAEAANSPFVRYALRSSNVAQRLVATHNAERAAARVAPMVWDAQLAAGAIAHAQFLAASGRFEHSNRRARPGVGENLWMGSQGAFSPEQMIGNWASEKRWFRPGVFPNVSRNGNWAQVAHYTQMIWPTTTRVGCGLASARGRDVLVCRYSPKGNVDGRPVI